MPNLTHKEAAEVYMSFNLFRSVEGSAAAACRRFSLQHRLYSTISESIAFRLEIPFMMMVTTNRGRTHCAYNEDTWRKLAALITPENGECTEADVEEAFAITIDDLTDPERMAAPANDPSARKEHIAQSQFLFDASTLLKEDDELLTQLIHDSWAQHTLLLSEVLTSIDYKKHVNLVDDCLVLEALPEGITSAYVERAVSLTEQASAIYKDRDEFVSEIQSLAASYAPEAITEVSNEVLEFLQRKTDLITSFTSALAKVPNTSVIKIMNQTPTGFLNYPLPPY